jgi:hypothetical protein
VAEKPISRCADRQLARLLQARRGIVACLNEHRIDTTIIDAYTEKDLERPHIAAAPDETALVAVGGNTIIGRDGSEQRETGLAHRERPREAMARVTEVTLVDDLDGGKADETVTFSLDGKAFEIDLNAAHASQLRDALAPISARPAARRPAAAGAATPAKRPRATDPAPA